MDAEVLLEDDFSITSYVDIYCLFQKNLTFCKNLSF